MSWGRIACVPQSDLAYLRSLGLSIEDIAARAACPPTRIRRELTREETHDHDTPAHTSYLSGVPHEARETRGR